jgi:hypothetical protein
MAAVPALSVAMIRRRFMERMLLPQSLHRLVERRDEREGVDRGGEGRLTLGTGGRPDDRTAAGDF